MSDDEKRLQELFRAVLAEDSRRAPTFERMWESATRRTVVARPSLRLAAAGGFLVLLSAAATFVMYRPNKPNGSGGGATISISQWRSPTESLLRLPNQQLLSTTPRVGADALALIRSTPPSNSKGKRP